MNSRFTNNAMFMALMVALMVLAPVPALAMLDVKANHDNININYDYHGSTISVSGASDAGEDIVIKITSPDSEQKLMRKDKRAGVLWMNVEALHFSHIPDVYLLKSTRPPEDILSLIERDAHAISYGSLEHNARIEPDRGPEQKGAWFGQFVEYKKSRNLYKAYKENDIKVNRSGSVQNFSTVFQWPFEASPGRYSVEVYAVKDGKVAEKSSSEVLVEQTGAVKMLSGMARSNGALYGVLSILIALASGFGVGLVFGKGGGAH